MRSVWHIAVNWVTLPFWQIESGTERKQFRDLPASPNVKYLLILDWTFCANKFTRILTATIIDLSENWWWQSSFSWRLIIIFGGDSLWNLVNCHNCQKVVATFFHKAREVFSARRICAKQFWNFYHLIIKNIRRAFFYKQLFSFGIASLWDVLQEQAEMQKAILIVQLQIWHPIFCIKFCVSQAFVHIFDKGIYTQEAGRQTQGGVLFRTKYHR